MVIKQNMQAFNANRQLNKVEREREKSVEKLSSGYKVNRSADDAVRLSISEKMRKQIRGLTRAAENVEDGVSLCQVIDGAMSEMHDMVNRMNELSVQAANGTNSESDWSYIQDEIDNIVTEFDRIIETTKFNEVYVFKYYQEKWGDNKGFHDSLDIRDVDGIKAWKGSKLSDYIDLTAGIDWRYIKRTPSGTGKVKGAWIDFTDFKASSEADFIKQLDQRGFDSSCCQCTTKYYGIKFVSELDPNGKILNANGINFNYHRSMKGSRISEVLKISLKDIWNKYANQTGKSLGEIFCESLGDAIEAAGNQSGSNLTSHLTSYAYEKGKARFYILDNANSYSNMSTFSTMPRDDSGEIEKNEPKVRLIDKKHLPKRKLAIQAGMDEISDNKINITLPTMTLESLGLNEIKVISDSLATNAINLLTAVQKLISEERSRIGGYQNRLEHTANNLKNVVENTTASESMIKDTDMADEMVRYSGKNILMRSGQSMLSQSNTCTQRVMRLLEA